MLHNSQHGNGLSVGTELLINRIGEEIDYTGIIKSMPMSPVTDLKIMVGEVTWRFQYLSKYEHDEKLPEGYWCSGHLIKGNDIHEVQIKVK